MVSVSEETARSAINDDITKIIRTISHSDEKIKPSTTLADLDFNSLNMAELDITIREEYDIQLMPLYNHIEAMKDQHLLHGDLNCTMPFEARVTVGEIVDYVFNALG